MKLIISADDFGWDSSINSGVMLCWHMGICSQASLMGTMPGFLEACALARKDKFEGRLGVHIVLRDGFPLTDAIKSCPRFCDKDGKLKLAVQDHLPSLSADEKRAVAEEVRAQIRRVKSEGIKPTHIDSHLNFHLRWHLSALIGAVAKEEGIMRMRLLQNLWPDKLCLGSRLKVYIMNQRLRSWGFRTPDYYAPLDVAARALSSGRKFPSQAVLETNIHARFDHNLGLIDEAYGKQEKDFPLVLKSLLEKNSLISYADL